MTGSEPRRRRWFVARRVRTMDLARPRARAFAVEAGRIVAIGSEQEVAAAVAPGSPRIDLQGLDVLPGFHDAHTHLSGGAIERSGIDLRGVASSSAACERVRRAALRVGAGEWVRGFGWDETLWRPDDRPTREALDRAAPFHPVLLGRVDGHAVWVNTRALREVAADPAGTEGVLREGAAEAARRRAPLPPPNERAERVARQIEEATRLGLTSVEDVAEPWSLPVYRSLLEGRRVLRVGAWLPVEFEDREADEWRRLHPPDDPWLSCGVRKAFLDGTLGSRTAAVGSPYVGSSDDSGTLHPDLPALRSRLETLAGDGWAVALHAVGDRAVAAAIDLLRGLPAPGGGRRHRIEHAQVVAVDDLDRLGSSGAVVSVQPGQWLDDRRWLAERLGRRADAWVHPWRSLVRSGAILAFGSDWPVAPLDPRVALRASVLGGPEREDEWLDLETALAAYTAGPARAAGDERRGILREGAWADFVAVAERRRGGSDGPDDWTVSCTYVEGRRVWPEPEDPPV